MEVDHIEWLLERYQFEESLDYIEENETKIKLNEHQYMNENDLDK